MKLEIEVTREELITLGQSLGLLAMMRDVDFVGEPDIRERIAQKVLDAAVELAKKKEDEKRAG